MEVRGFNRKMLAALIDHTELHVDASYGDIRRLCLEAVKYGVASVTIHPVNIPLAVELLKDSKVKVDAVIGFPTGAYTIEGKVFETKDAIAKGAQEIDFVINVGALKAGDDTLVMDEMRAIKETAGDLITKAILETCVLTDEEKVKACRIAIEAGIDFVKTSTGFGQKGATVEDVRLMRQTVGKNAGVKASGGIRTTQDALAMIDAGATRLGTSAGVAIIEGLVK
jgi:deoxyribose-phosphate aldolase